MRLSQRIRAVVGESGDDGWGVYYRARAQIAEGRAVANLTIGDHDVKTDPAILAAMNRSMEAGNLGYAPVEGSGPLRAAIAARATRETGAPVEPDQIAVTAGGQAALFAAMMATSDPGDEVIVLDPFYATYAQTVRAAGATPVVVPCPAEGGFQPDAALIAAAVTPRTRTILLNTPNNPSGAVYTAEALQAVGEVAIRHDLWIVSDEVYAAQIWQGAHVSPRSLAGLAERTVVVSSVSKSHAMTGSRLGWALGPREVAARIADLLIATNYGVSGFIQDASAWALAEGAEIEAEIRDRYARRRAAALAAIPSDGPVRVVQPQGGMFVMLDIRATGLSGVAFAEALLDDRAIAVMPGESFGTAAAGHLRVALTRPEDELAVAMASICSFSETFSV